MIYGYIRVSTDRQDTENQKIGILSKAKMLDLVIDEWIADDGVSGSKEPEKRLLGPLLTKIKKGDVIIASEISRLGRKLFMIMRILEHCMKMEAKVYTVKDGYELGDNIQSKVLAFAFGLAAEIERDMIQKRTIEGLARRRAQGVILGRPAGRGDGYVSLKGKENDVKQYLDAGLNYSQIARLLMVDKQTIRNFAVFKGWQIDGNFFSGKQNTTQVYNVLSPDKIKRISELVEVEPSVKKIMTLLDIKLTPTVFTKYLKVLGLYETWVTTNNHLRIINNIDCGKNKR
jgi:DNA invertase Pin-like site-specific DNA recombinase